MFYLETAPMHPLPQHIPVDARQTEADSIAAAYRRLHRGDDRAALLAVIIDALADLAQGVAQTAERVTLKRLRLRL